MAEAGPPAELETVGQALERQADRLGEQPFLTFGDQQLSYGELDRRANAIANELAAGGVEPGEPVCLFLYNSLEYVAAYFALAKLGAVVAPVDTRFSGETLEAVLSRTEANTIVVDAETRAAYEDVRSQIPNLTTEYYVSDESDTHPYRDFDRLLDGDRDSPPAAAPDETDTLSVTFVQRHAAEKPKGVMLPHYSYLNTGWEVSANIFDFSASDRLFTTLPLYSIFTVQLGVMGALLADAEFVLAPPFEPDAFWDQVATHDATIILYLGRMLSVLYNQEAGLEREQNPVDLAIGHGFGFGTDETLIENFEERFGITVLEGYGVTQTATIATYNRPTDRKIGSSGRPVSYADVAIVDENDWPLEAGETGEIVVRPRRPNTMLQGYYNDPSETVEVCRNQWIHSGDIGYLDEEGYLHFVANEDNSIYRGQIAGRISSLEIESVINSHAAVEESAVVGVENEGGGEEIKAVVVPDADTDLNPVDVCRHCEQQLPYLKVPRYIDVRGELPRNATGEVRKQHLRERNGTDVWDRESGFELSH